MLVISGKDWRHPQPWTRPWALTPFRTQMRSTWKPLQKHVTTHQALTLADKFSLSYGWSGKLQRYLTVHSRYNKVSVFYGHSSLFSVWQRSISTQNFEFYYTHPSRLEKTRSLPWLHYKCSPYSRLSIWAEASQAFQWWRYWGTQCNLMMSQRVKQQYT